ncbi:MAG: HAD-IIB family hydrolase [SAR202 cluster bacterium]|nr:HAD-IIB family hydrolase [SAR202 cluster bacterium]MDP6513271.1 HAD-IIB family hydrolase [SAR202 cluster bacterium]
MDLDGTLIGPDERISPRVAQAVRRVSQRIPVSIATGREPKDAIGYAQILGLTTRQISDNGALILDSTGNEVWSVPLGQINSARVMEIIAARGYPFIATHPGGTILDFREIESQDLTRISALDMTEDVADALVEETRAYGAMNIVKASLPYNGLWAVDFTSEGVDKAAAARVLASMTGIQANQFVAAGDSYNDLPMLKLAGMSISMGNAPDQVKQVADYVAPSVEEDGLAVAIDEFILPSLDHGGVVNDH